MKGFLKGLKYIQQIFEDEEEEEPEMQIGLPTDVKHVAHIGHDGPSANAPSWMTEYNPAPELSAASLPPQYNGDAKNSGSHEIATSHEKPKHKSRRKSSTGSGSPLGSPRSIEKHTRRRSANIAMESPGRDASNHGRRHHSSNLGSDSPMRDVSAASPCRDNHTRQSRRNRTSNHGAESPMHDGYAPPRQSRPKKSSKGTCGEGSTRSSRCKGQTSLPDCNETGSEGGMDSQRSSFSDTHLLEIKGDERYRN